MKMDNGISQVFINTNKLKILYLLLTETGKDIYEAEIARKIGISKSSVNSILKELLNENLIKYKNMGKMKFYFVDTNNSYLKEFKVFVNMIMLFPLIEELKLFSTKIILFGSCALGEDNFKSDIDIYVESYKKKETLNIIDKYSMSKQLMDRKIQLIIKNPLENLKDKVFYNQLLKGKVLWEKEIEEDVSQF